MAILAAAIAACAAMMLVVLIVPVRVDLELDVGPEPAQRSFCVRVGWWFLSWHTTALRRRGPTPARRPRPRRRSRRGSGLGRAVAALGTRGFVRRVGRLVIEVLRALAPRTVNGVVMVGLDDPASTGAFFGAAHAALGLAHTARWNVRLEPAFEGPAFAGYVRLAWAVRPGAVLWPVGTFLVSPTTWRAAFAALRAK